MHRIETRSKGQVVDSESDNKTADGNIGSET